MAGAHRPAAAAPRTRSACDDPDRHRPDPRELDSRRADCRHRRRPLLRPAVRARSRARAAVPPDRHDRAAQDSHADTHGRREEPRQAGPDRARRPGAGPAARRIRRSRGSLRDRRRGAPVDLGAGLGEAFTTDVRAAWTTAYGTLATVMIEAARTEAQVAAEAAA